MNSASIAVALGCLAAAVAGPAWAAGNATAQLEMRTLAAGCAGCHGSDGHAVPGAGIASLAGQRDTDLLATLRAYKSGTQPATVMQQIAKGYSDAQLAALAAYFAAVK